jgi:hypothetical protein
MEKGTALTSLTKLEQRNAYKREWEQRNPKRTWAKHALKDAKKRAIKKDIPFELSRDYLISIMQDKCPVFGTEFKWMGNGKIMPESPNLDRIKPSLGYVEGNVVIISSRANNIKSYATWQEIRMVSDWLKNQTAQNKG